MNENELVKLIQDGEMKYFGQLYDMYIKKIYDFIFYKTYHKEVAEDITSQVFLKVYKKINQYNVKKKWIQSSLKSNGSITIDDGAANALLKGKSLLPVGIIDVNGTFKRGDTISILDKKKSNIGIGVTSYSNDEISKIKGTKSDNIKEILGYSSRGEVIHIDNMVLN